MLRVISTGALSDWSPLSTGAVPGKVWLATTTDVPRAALLITTSRRVSNSSPAFTFAVTSIWQRTLVRMTATEGPPPWVQTVGPVGGTHVTDLMLAEALVATTLVTLSVAAPQTLGTTVEQALMETPPTARVVTLPSAATVALAGSPLDQRVSTAYSPEEEQEIEARLRHLGYME